MDGKKNMKKQIKDCWNLTGVWGDEKPPCPELAHVVHCRNCPVFIAAGRDLFNRTPPADYIAEWRKVLAEEKISETKGTVSVLIFCIGREWLAFPSVVFREITWMQVLHRIPHRTDEILMGLVNIRGELQLCVSLQTLLGIEEKNSSGKGSGTMAHKRLIVVEKEGSVWVFPVDDIHGVHRYDPNALQNVPATVSKATATYTKGVFSWNKRSVAHLDDDLIFYTLNRRTA